MSKKIKHSCAIRWKEKHSRKQKYSKKPPKMFISSDGRFEITHYPDETWISDRKNSANDSFTKTIAKAKKYACKLVRK